MNILYVGSPQLFKEGASSIHVARMCEAFVELNHNVELILPINKNELEIIGVAEVSYLGEYNFE